MGLAAAPLTGHAQDAAKQPTLHGGPLDGIVLVEVSGADGKPHLHMKPSLQNASPLSGTLVDAVTRLLAAYDAGDRDRFRGMLTADVVTEICSPASGCGTGEPFFAAQFAEHCDRNTPYFMSESQQVRIEWICRDRLSYFSFLTFRNGKVSHLKTMDAVVPYMPSRAASQ